MVARNFAVELPQHIEQAMQSGEVVELTMKLPTCERAAAGVSAWTVVTRYTVCATPKRGKHGGSCSNWMSEAAANAALPEWQERLGADFRVEVEPTSWLSYDGGLTGLPMGSSWSTVLKLAEPVPAEGD